MEEIVSSNLTKVRPTLPEQMPWIVITCGSKDNDPHGLSWVAEFYDARFPDAGHSYPRNDMPINSEGDFTWDCYRMDIGKTQTLAPKRPGDDPVSAREHKSALRTWDSPDGFYMECNHNILYESRQGLRQRPCKKRTLVKREDWNEFGRRLIEHGVIKLGASPYFISWEFLMTSLHAIQTQRIKNT